MCSQETAPRELWREQTIRTSLWTRIENLSLHGKDLKGLTSLLTKGKRDEIILDIFRFLIPFTL
jgi:hypothetical protein